MPLRHYGVLSARPVDRRREGAGDTPHYQIHLRDAAGTEYRAAVNVESQQAPSELLYLVVEDFRHPVTELLPAGPAGWTPLPSRPGTAALDFVRGGLFDPAGMRTLPPDRPGADNDLADLLDRYVGQAIADPAAVAYVFGERWPTEAGIPDKVFGFRPGNGVHDVHMNQGNSGRFRADDGVRQDGALLLRLGAPARWVAVFLAFQSQSRHTDDTTGHRLEDVPAPRPGHGGPGGDGTPDGDGRAVRIVAALVNPVGPAPEAETVTLRNSSAAPVSLAGWQLVDQERHRLTLPAQRLEAGAEVVLPVSAALRLGNRGGALTLLDPAGRTVHSVAYTARQAAREGAPITF
ncbi:DUF2278 family protein [Kitasatospora camelliae]|uniref:DUF2278 family protein n=1 Tax=Kitasatospora camelliae TaxID=3156397 RepID=A0AAU8K2Q7_9ACTN